MRKVISLAACCVFSVAGFAQSLDRQVIGSAGTSSSAGGIEISYTVGETVVETFSAGTLVLTQGFQQPDATVVGIEDVESGLSILAYPNPTSGQVVLEFTTPQNMELNIELHDMGGKKLGATETVNVANGTKHLLDLTGFAAGNYFISLVSSDGKMQKAVQVQKTD